jgi:opacity protein-like surface antigen
MKKFLIAAAGLSAIAAAAPAAAQYYPQQPVPYGYGQQVPYGHNQQYGYNQQYGHSQHYGHNPQYGYNQHYGHNQQYGYGQQYGYANQQQLIHAYVTRADQLRRQVERFDSRNRVSNREAARLRAAAIDLQNRTRAYARGGIDPNEQRDLDIRFAQLQQRIAYEARDNNNRYGQGYGRGIGGGRDRDRDGLRNRYDGMIDANRNGIDDRQEGFLDRDRDGRDDRYEDDRGRYPG